MMKRAFLCQVLAASVLLATAFAAPMVHAEDEAPDALIKRLSTDVLETRVPVRYLQNPALRVLQL